ncbi:hypothetical protein [Sphingopyxis granuli]|uniref:hypothetical protein n=2 Tax=Sphingopyxis granuli TaxID=267128 RepID=UPI0012E77AD1|nr:hypothetical protein [Sphingopyxis granuli]
MQAGKVGTGTDSGRIEKFGDFLEYRDGNLKRRDMLAGAGVWAVWDSLGQLIGVRGPFSVRALGIDGENVQAHTNAFVERFGTSTAPLAEFGPGVGLGNGTADTDAFIAAAAALTNGDITELSLPPAILYLEDSFDIAAPPDRISILGAGRDKTRIITSVTSGQPARQYPWVIRNTAHGTLVQGFAIEVDSPDPLYYQNAFTFCNVSNLTLQDFLSEGSDQYGVGVFDDVIALPRARTARACHNIVIRNGIISNASQYGIQHFPKVLSDGLLVDSIELRNCGRNVQNWLVPNQLEPAAIKCGQSTRRTRLNNIDIVCAADAGGIAIANHEDYVGRDIRIRNAPWQAISISASTHPALISRYPENIGDPAPPPYLPTHGKIDIEATIEHRVSEAGKRLAAVISGQFGGTAKIACKAGATENIAISGEKRVGGVACIAGDRVLLTGQTLASQNGIWIAASGAWTRAADFNTTSEVVNGSVVNVAYGSARGGWILISTDPHTVGTAEQIWSRFNPAGPRIRAAISGEIIEAGSYNSFEGAVQFQGGVDVPGVDLDIIYVAGDTAGIAGNPALPPAVVYLNGDVGGRAIEPKINISVSNPYRVKQATFMALWLKGLLGADVAIKARNMGNYVFRGNDNTGLIKFSKFDVTDYNLTGDIAQALVIIGGSTGEYHFDNPVYAQNRGVGSGSYWVLGGGKAPVYLNNPRALNVDMAVTVNPLVVVLNERRGTAVLSGGTVNVRFGHDMQNTNYHVTLSGNAGEVFSWSSKTAAGFTISSDNPASTAAVDWVVTP